MANIHIKNLPDELYQAIKQSAAAHHRSINSEIIFSLELMLRSRSHNVRRTLARLKELQERLDLPWLTDDILRRSKKQGRA